VKTLIAFGILLVVGFLGSVKLFHRLKVSSPFSYLFYSGTVFIFFGLIIGENGFNLLSRETVHHLEPLIHFSLGWVGFIFGFQLELKYLKRIRWRWYIGLVASYLVTFLAVFFLTFAALRLFTHGFIDDIAIAIGFSLVLAILIPESSISFVVWCSKFFKHYISQFRFLSFIASVDNIFPILVTGILFSLYKYMPSTQGITALPASRFLVSFGLQALIGTLSGVFLHYLLKRIQEKLEISAVLLGVIFFISGLSLMAGFSPLFVSMLAGAVFSNLTRRHSYFLKIITPTEKPIYLIFLVYLTMQKAELPLEMILLAIVLLVFKYLSKGTVFMLINKFSLLNFKLSPFFSYILLPLSSVAPAILLDLFIAFPGENTRRLMGLFIFSQVLMELFAPGAIKITQKRLDKKNKKAGAGMAGARKVREEAE
jgi:hypothetical protein